MNIKLINNDLSHTDTHIQTHQASSLSVTTSTLSLFFAVWVWLWNQHCNVRIEVCVWFSLTYIFNIVLQLILNSTTQHRDTAWHSSIGQWSLIFNTFFFLHYLRIHRFAFINHTLPVLYYIRHWWTISIRLAGVTFHRKIFYSLEIASITKCSGCSLNQSKHFFPFLFSLSIW